MFLRYRPEDCKATGEGSRSAEKAPKAVLVVGITLLFIGVLGVFGMVFALAFHFMPEDVVGIWTYIARDSVTAADRLVDRLTQAYEILSANPELGEAVPQYRQNLRRLSVGSYILYYEQQTDVITIVRVLHGARDQAAEL